MDPTASVGPNGQVRSRRFQRSLFPTEVASGIRNRHGTYADVREALEISVTPPPSENILRPLTLPYDARHTLKACQGDRICDHMTEPGFAMYEAMYEALRQQHHGDISCECARSL